jgi:hypothetical protein
MHPALEPWFTHFLFLSFPFLYRSAIQYPRDKGGEAGRLAKTTTMTMTRILRGRTRDGYTRDSSVPNNLRLTITLRRWQHHTILALPPPHAAFIRYAVIRLGLGPDWLTDCVCKPFCHYHTYPPSSIFTLSCLALPFKAFQGLAGLQGAPTSF